MESSSQFKLLERQKSGPAPRTEDFTLRYLSKGSFGKVFHATHKKTGEVYALKEISKFDKNRQKSNMQLHYINQQMRVMYALDCQYICRLYDHYETDVSICLLLEYIEGMELYKGVIQREIQLEGRVCARIIWQLCQALQHLHQRNIVHRDIKPENILLTRQSNIKLIDFGTANYFGPGINRTTKIGSLPYFAPEIIEKKGHDNAVDVWCVGILLFELHFFRTPFEHEYYTEANILNKQLTFPAQINPEVKDLISKILVKSAAGRLTLEQIMNHPWISRNVPKPQPLDQSKSSNNPARKNALIYDQNKVKDWSTTKGQINNASSQKIKSVPKAMSKSVPKKPSPSKELQQKIKKLEKQIQSANATQMKLQQKQKLQWEKRVREKEFQLDKMKKEKMKRKQLLNSNETKISKLIQEIEKGRIIAEQLQKLMSEMTEKNKHLEEIQEESKHLKLRQLSLGMELKQFKNYKPRNRSRSNSNLSFQSLDRPMVHHERSETATRYKSKIRLVPQLKLNMTVGQRDKPYPEELSKTTGRTQGSMTIGQIDTFIVQMRQKRKAHTLTDD